MTRILRRPVVLCFLLLAAMRGAPGPSDGHKLFVIKPNPPSSASDLEVVFGGDGDDVRVRVGDGDTFQPKIDKDRSFRIPKKLLKPGQRLYLIEVGGTGEHNLCVLIEPD